MKKILRWMFLLVLLGTMVTTTHAQSFSYLCDFESDTLGWTMVNGNCINRWRIGTAANNTANGSTGLYIFNDSSTFANTYNNSSNSYVCAYKEFTLEAGVYDVSYDWKCIGEGFSYSRVDYLRVALVPGAEQINASTSSPYGSSVLPDGWTALDGGSPLNGNGSWRTQNSTVTVLAGGNYKLAFFWRNDASGGENPPAAIDNISFSIQSCPSPANLLVSNLSSTSATIGWTEIGSATTWQLEYGPAGFSRGEGTLVSDLYSTSYTLSNLNANTSYDVYVQSICSASDISSASVFNFRTSCGTMVLPEYENFENYGDILFPLCWFQRGGETDIYQTYGSSKALRIRDNALVMTPKYPIPTNESAIHFQAHPASAYSSGVLEVGIVTDTLLWNYVPIRTISPMDAENHIYEISLEDLDVIDPCHFVLTQKGSTSRYSPWYIDEVHMFQLGNCRAPQDFSFTGITDNAATLNWSSLSNADFQIQVSCDDSVYTIDVFDGATSYTLNNLQPNTVYKTMIRSLCGDSDSSYWQEMGGFKTAPLCADLVSFDASYITSTSAVIHWVYANTGIPHSGVSLRYQSLTDTTDVWSSASISGNSYFLTNLQPEQTYQVEIAVVCGNDSSSVLSLSFATPSGNCGEAIGSGDNSTTNIPFQADYNYSYSQSLYAADIFMRMDTIKGIAYHTQDDPVTRFLTIYLGNTDKDVFSSGNDFVPSTDLTQVFSDSVHFSGNGWDSITFSTPFVLNEGNVVVVVEDKTHSYTFNYPRFYSHMGSALYDGDDYSPITNATVSVLSKSYKVPDARFLGNCAPLTCSAPSLACLSSDASSVTLAWMPGLDESEWRVEYRAANDDGWNIASANTTDTSITISNLIASTSYIFRVGSLCSNDTLYAYVSGYTSCGTISVPYFEDFAADIVNPCWGIGNRNLNAILVPTISSEQLHFSANNYVILPQVTEAINTLQLRFNMTDVDGSSVLYIGTTSDQNSISTFVPLDTVRVDLANPDADVIVSLANYDGEGGYIAILASHEVVEIDNLHIETIPTCPQPIHVRVNNLGATYVSLTWDADPTASSWVVKAVPSGASFASVSPIAVSDNSVMISDLTANTQYDFYVGAVCDTDSSRYAKVVAKTMSVDPFNIPFSCDFSDVAINSQWSYYSVVGSTNSWSIGNAVSNTSANALYVSNNSGVSNNYVEGVSVSVAYIPIHIADDGRYSLTFDWQCDGESSYDFGRLALVQAPYDFTTMPTSRGDYISDLPMRWVAMDGNSKLNSQDSWITTVAKHYLTSGTYYLVAFWINDNSSTFNPPLAIDNISLEPIACPEPMGLHVENVTAGDATIIWLNDEMVANGWEITLNDELTFSTMDTFYTFTGLTPGMGYEVKVRSVCSDDQMSMYATTQFFTICSDILELPYTANFNTEIPATTDSDPHCWTISTDGYPSVSTQYSDNGSLHFYCYESMFGTSYLSNMASLPRLGGHLTLDELELQFNGKANNISPKNKLYIGVSKAPGDVASLTILDSISDFTNEWQSFVIPLSGYADTGKYISLYAKSAGLYRSVRFMIDDIVLQKTSPCARPTSARIDSYTYNSAVINWYDTNQSATFKLAYSTVNNVAMAENVVNNIVSAPYTINNLDDNTTYNVWLAADCPDCDTLSSWVYVGHFTTSPKCAPIEHLQVIDIDETHATLTWNAPSVGTPATDYIVSYQMNANTPVIDTIQVPYYFLSNLMTDSLYKVTITTICDSIVSTNNMAVFTPQPVPDCTVMGIGDETSSNSPVPTNWNFGFSQMIYLADELTGMGDTINGVSFIRLRGTATRNITVYMGETDLAEFTSDFEPLDYMTQVYDGEWNLTVGESHIDFSTPFIRTDHSKNLILVVDDNTSSYGSSGSFQATECDARLLAYSYGDDANYTGREQPDRKDDTRPDVIFDASCQPITCFPPSVVVSNITDIQADLVWRAGNDETAWRVEYSLLGSNVWNLVDDNHTTTSISISNLLPGHDYLVRVGSICGSNIAYREISMTTLCGPMPLPFYEDFAYMPLANFHPQCWYAEGATAPKVMNRIGNGHVLRINDNAYVALPEISGNMNELQVRIKYITNDDSVWSLFGYMDDYNEILTFHVIDTLYCHNDRGWYNTFRLGNLPDEAQGRFAIYTPHNLDYTYIDDILIEPLNDCIEPTQVTISNVTTNSANVAWSGSATNYMVEYGVAGFTLGSGTVLSTANTNIQLSNLNPGTMYQVYVYAVCGNGDTSYATNAVNFNTECAPLASLPYVMNFEEAYLPSAINTGMLPLCWSAHLDSNDASVGPQIVYDYRGSYATNGHYMLNLNHTAIVALPEMSADINTLCIRFSDLVTSSTSLLVVGVLDHIGEGCESTFQPIDTIAPVSLDQPNRYAVFFNNYTGTGKFIAFKNINVDASNNDSEHYLDSIVVDVIPQCPEVNHIHMVSNSASNIVLDWDDFGTNVSAWQIEYGQPGFDLGSGTSIIVNAHPTAILNLEPLTTYEFWVRPICSASDTGFYGYRPYRATTSLCDGPITSTSAPYGTTETSGNIPFDAMYNYSYSQTIIDASYVSDQTDIVALQFSATLPSGAYYSNTNIWLGHTSKTSFSSDNDWISSDSLQLVYAGDLVYEAGVVTISFDTAFHYDGNSNLIVAIDRNDGDWISDHDFYIVADTAAMTLSHANDYMDFDPANPSYVGERANEHTAFSFISCSGVSCQTPILTNVTDLTHETATIHWVNTSVDNNFEVAFRMQDEANMSTPVAVTGDAYSFTNLTPNTTYAYYVRQVCEVGVYSEWAEGNFVTNDLPCDVPTNLSVDSKTAETVTFSWNASENQSQWTIHVFNTLEDHIDTVTTNPATITGLMGGVTYHATINAICATNYASEWSDTIEFSTEDCLPVSNVEVSNITANSAIVTWIAGSDASAWEINYGESGFGQGQGELADAASTTYTITGLEADSEYDVYVRTICSENFNSVWSDVVTFSTLATTPEGIDGVEGNFQFTIYPNPTSNTTTIRLNGVEGQVEISIVDMNGRMLQTETLECGSDCEKRIDIAHLSQGTYFVRVLGDGINSVRKLIVR